MALKVSIFTSAPAPFGGGVPDPSSPDAGVWSPISCTLIYTDKSALLTDCPPSIAKTEELADWVATTLPSGCKLEYFIPTHAHGDHIFGAPILQSRFPGVKPVASANVLSGIEHQYEPNYYNAVWVPLFPTTSDGAGLPEEKTTFSALPASNQINLDNHIIQVVDVGHGDTHSASFIYVADLDLVVAGDIVYNRDCHQFLGEANTAAKRQQWLEALDKIAQYKPKIVVPGHTFKPSAVPDEPLAKDMLAGTREYIEAFAQELSKASDAKSLFDTMRAKYSSRWNLFILNYGCEAGIANKS